MAHRTTLEAEKPSKPAKPAKAGAAAPRDTAAPTGRATQSGTIAPAGTAARATNPERERIFDAFRRWGYYEATLDPLGFFKPLKYPDLDLLSGRIADEARALLLRHHRRGIHASPGAGTPPLDCRGMERSATQPDQQKILERLIRADLFEQVLQAAISAPNVFLSKASPR